MKASIYILTIMVGLFMISCQKKKKVETESLTQNQRIEYELKGRDISASTQAVLLQHVGGAIAEGGMSNAVQYCNLNAFSIVDSLNHKYDCNISRISIKNRNPQNGLTIETDKKIWKWFEESYNKSGVVDTVLLVNEKATYYKAIKIAIPTCLSCHGIPDENLHAEALKEINRLYPEDKARNYKMNDLRGLWKIEFNTGE